MKAVKQHVERQFALASKYWDRGDTRRAFTMFKTLAELGDAGAQLNVGYFFDQGIAVRRNETKAIYWYRRAYANGQAAGAKNIGTIFRDHHQVRRAIAWFERALKAGDHGAALEIAKIYLGSDSHQDRALEYLRMVSLSDSVSEGEQEAASKLLKEPTFGRSKQAKGIATSRKSDGGRIKSRRVIKIK